MCKKFQKEILTKDVIILLLVAVLGLSNDFQGASRVIWLIALGLNVAAVVFDALNLRNTRNTKD